MNVSEANAGIRIYNVTSASKSAIPHHELIKNKDRLKKDTAWRSRIELLQDFTFPEASTNLKVTEDGLHLVATGVYKPQVRVWDVAQLALKFERHTVSENVTFELLAKDWTKSVHLQTDRALEFHSHYGMHYRTRIPKAGRDLKFHYPSSDLFVCGLSNEVWRLNLEQGAFLKPFETSLPEINKIAVNPAHQLLCFGGADGNLEFWDHRARKCISTLNVASSIIKSIDSSLLDSIPQCTSLAFNTDGLTLLSGSSTGQIAMFDLRNPTPLLIKDHQYGFPIHSLGFHTSDVQRIVSSDKKICKIWQRDGSVMTTIENTCDINAVCVIPESGMIMFANEGVDLQSYYIPALGPAPKWCPFLDNLTEELEETEHKTYDDYKFVTKSELDNLALTHLIGTNLLKAYMHGYFVDSRLYQKAKAISNPFEFAEYKKLMVQKRLEEKRKSRITAVRRLPKINSNMAAKLTTHLIDSSDDDQDIEVGKKKKKRVAIANQTDENPLGDSRFKDMFADDDFQVDEDSHEYRLHHPSESQASITNRRFEPVKENGGDGDSEDSDDNAIRNHRHKSKGPKMFQLKQNVSGGDEKMDLAARIGSLTTESNKEKIVVEKGGNKSISWKLDEPKPRASTYRQKQNHDDGGVQDGAKRVRNNAPERGGRGRGRGGVSRGSSRGSSGRGGSSRGSSRGSRGNGGRGGFRGRGSSN